MKGLDGISELNFNLGGIEKMNKHNKIYALVNKSCEHPDLSWQASKHKFNSLSKARSAAADLGKQIVMVKFFPDSGDVDYVDIVY